MNSESEAQVFNPAARLHDLLSAAHVHPLATPGEVAPLAIVVWSHILACGPEDEDLFIRRFMQLRRLKVDAERGVTGIAGINQALYMRWARPVSNLLSVSTLYRPWSQVNGSLSEAVLQSLEYAAHELSRHHLQIAIPPDQLNRLRADVKTLLDDVDQSSLSPGIRERISSQLRAILDALSDYDIRGIEVVELVLDSAVGDTILRRQEYLERQEHEVIKRYAHLLWRLVELMNLASHLNALPEVISRLLS